MAPKNENLCDNCNIELSSRSDDNAESFKTNYERSSSIPAARSSNSVDNN